MGCVYTSDINNKLVPKSVAPRMLDMVIFPDQSQINILLKRFTQENIAQFKEVHHQLFIDNSQSPSINQIIIIDIDQTGLIANGKNFEHASKGYFPRKRGEKDYQVSTAFCGNTG